MKATLLASILLMSSIALADGRVETDYCAGYRVGFLFEYCHRNNTWCLRRHVKCSQQAGTFAQGMAFGKVIAGIQRKRDNQVRREIRRRLAKKPTE